MIISSLEEGVGLDNGLEDGWDSKWKRENNISKIEGVALAKAKRQESRQKFLIRIALLSDAIRVGSSLTEKVS